MLDYIDNDKIAPLLQPQETGESERKKECSYQEHERKKSSYHIKMQIVSILISCMGYRQPISNVSKQEEFNKLMHAYITLSCLGIIVQKLLSGDVKQIKKSLRMNQ
ncbi:uncharacterized protein PHALS_14933 [Plasmopara halstedii]|uniref:Uncharacterized protein n=1 Tax=Plasmopara halstedii TaxID=4781 RepID=A0A0P1AWG0_PLAHL|nr:uncharacterized protein PHALS_14933 [Plasmopara halstedii]CEG46754.1 hypothetical protein PHALS_14933 [Plasmopara halstedii]|eukprot:XP_024583123.1 hypothetical protein PHALS_14933 [Plasmopara halstedii]